MATISQPSRAMKTYEYWAHVPTNQLWAVAMEDAAVVQACWPLDQRHTIGRLLAYLPYTTEDVGWIERSRANFKHTTLPG